MEGITLRELFKVISRKKYLAVFTTGTIYFIAEYGISFALGFFATSPFTEEKAIALTLTILILEIIMRAVSWIDSFLVNYTYEDNISRIQKYYFKKARNMSSKNMIDTHTGMLNNLVLETADLFATTLMYFTVSAFPLVVGCISFAGALFTQSIAMGIISILLMAGMVISKYTMLSKRSSFDKEARKKRSEFRATFIDFIQNIVTVRKLNIDKFCEDKLQEKGNIYMKAVKKNEVKRSNTNVVSGSMIGLLYITVLVSSIFMVRDGKDALPYLLFYMTMINTIYQKLNSLVRTVDSYVKFKASKKQLDEHIGKSAEIDIVNEWNILEIEKARFSYRDKKNIIKIPKFILNKKDHISIMGESGQGKTTTLNILAGLYKLDKGKIKIDGEEKENTILDMVFVSQEVDLFDLTIRENLCLGKDVSEERILELFKEAGLLEWYNELPNGLDTMVGEKGVRLSVGQKQRLNIIRGILIDKEVYLFDEPTSNLDVTTEKKIIKMIEKHLNNKTYIIVTHREALKNLCTKHYVFENNEMKESSLQS